MSTQQLQLVCDSSTLTNFKAWAKPISDWFTSCGWTTSSDTGQVDWTSIASVPGSGSYVYEIWKPGDALTTCYLKVEYGNGTTPQIRVSLATGTNGSGTLNGFVTSLMTIANQNAAAPSTTTQYECNFSGTTGRIAVMMWRNSPNNNQQFFAVERSLNSSGVATSTYVTLYSCGQQGSLGSGRHQSMVFGVGVAQDTLISGDHTALNVGGFNGQATGDIRSLAFNGSLPVDFVRPMVGYYDYPGTVVGAGSASDFVSGVTLTATVYGATVTYMPASNNHFSHCAVPANAAIASLLMRYD